MSEENQEKPHKPSEKKKKQLLKDGSFLRSKELSSGLVLISAMAILVVISPHMMQHLNDNLIDAFSAIAKVSEFNQDLVFLYKKIAFNSLLLLAPLVIPLIIIIISAVFAFGGFGLSFKLVKPKLSRLNPMSNLKKNFSLLNLFEVFKSTLKLLLFLILLVFFLLMKLDDIFNLYNLNNESSLTMAFELIKFFFLTISCGIILIIGLDMLHSRVTHQRKTMMSHQELKDEFKENEANPEVKKRVRAIQYSMSKQRIRADVPKATVIITNPTHFAIALQYKERVDKAPIVLAKGKDALAADIRLLGVKHSIPIYQAPKLARALYYSAHIGEPIHEALYMAVALVLSYLHQLKLYQHGIGDMPEKVNDLQIPEAFDFQNRD